MAKQGIDKARIGGYVAEAYGLHVIGGTLVSHEVKDAANNKKQVNIKVLLPRGPLDGIQRLTYDGWDITPDRYHFFAGGATTDDDTYFPAQIKHRGIARVSVALPDGAAGDDDPTKLAAIVRCKKIQQLNGDGSDEGVPTYSVNPANQIIDAIKMDSERRGLNYKDRIDLDSYRAALDWCAASLQYPEYGSVPKNYAVRKTNLGSIPAGNYAISIQGIHGDGSITIRTGEIVVTLSGDFKAIIVTGDPVPDAAQHRIWIRNVATNQFYRTTFAGSIVNGKVEYTVLSLGDTATPEAATGRYLLTRPRMESHCAFTQPTSLSEVLDSICLQSTLDWQKVGTKYKILLPHNRTVSFHFFEGNTMPNSFKFGRVPIKERINRIIVKFREITDAYLREAQPVHVNRDDAQNEHGVISEEIQLWGMSRHQAQRVMSYRMKQSFDRAMFCVFEDDASGAHLLPGDIVEVSDSGAGWDHKKFVITEIERQDTDSIGRRRYTLKEWYDLDYQDGDGNQLPSNGVELNQSPSKFIPPKPILSLSRTVSYEVKADGVVNNLITLGAQFQAHIVGQVGRVYHRKPGAADFQVIGLMHPDPDSNGSSFYVNIADTGVHYFKIQVESSLGVIQEGTPTTYDLNVLAYAAAPARPATAVIQRTSSLLKTTWVPSTTANTGEYLVTDGGGNEVARISGNIFEESVPDADAVTRRIYTVSTTGEVSLDYAQVVYAADYEDKRIVFDTSIGSDNFVPYGSDAEQFTEETVVSGVYSYGSYNPDTRIWHRDSTPNNWTRGWRADRMVAYGDCEVSFKIPYSYNAQTTTIGFGLGYGYGMPDGLPSMLYSMLAKTSFTGAANSPGLTWFVGSTEIFPNPVIPFALGDVLTIKITGTTVIYLKNNVALYVATNQNIPYPLHFDMIQYFANGSITPSSFKIKGFLQDITSPGGAGSVTPTFPRPHWKFLRGIKFDSFYNLYRSTVGTAWGDSGCSSIESFKGGGFVEFRHPNPDQSFCVACGLNDVDLDQHYTNMEYCVLAGSAAGLGLSNSGLKIYEAGVLKFTLDQQLDATHFIRICVEGGVVRYRLNGVTLYTSLNVPASTIRWYADTALMKENDILPDVVLGDVGSKAEGWRIKPDGVAEFGDRVQIGGVTIDQVKARAITAIDNSNRYRGNDYGVPETAQLNADMFRLDSVQIIEQDFAYTDLYVNIPDSVLKNTYANFDSVTACRVKVINIFGDEVAGIEHAFNGRGKVVVGIHSRVYADPTTNAMFSFEFKNNYGWSKPIYWTNAAGPHSSAEFWHYLGYFPVGVRGTTTVPTYAKRTHFPSNLSASAIDHTSIRLNWTDAQEMPDPNSRGIHYRVLRRAGLYRSAWVSFGNSAPPMTITGLQPDTEYEFLVHGGAGYRWGGFPVAKTLPPIHPLLLQNVSPSGLTARVDSNSQITLFWVRNASNNDAVEIYYENGTGIATIGGGDTSFVIGGLAANTTYRFKVRNKFNTGPTFSEFSNVAQGITTMPPNFYAPSGLNWSSTGATVYLTWNKNNGDNAVVEMNSGGGWIVIANKNAGVQSHSKYLGYDMSAWFRVRNSSPVNTPYTNEVDAYTEPNYESCTNNIRYCDL